MQNGENARVVYASATVCASASQLGREERRSRKHACAQPVLLPPRLALGCPRAPHPQLEAAGRHQGPRVAHAARAPRPQLDPLLTARGLQGWVVVVRRWHGHAAERAHLAAADGLRQHLPRHGARTHMDMGRRQARLLCSSLVWCSSPQLGITFRVTFTVRSPVIDAGIRRWCRGESAPLSSHAGRALWARWRMAPGSVAEGGALRTRCSGGRPAEM